MNQENTDINLYYSPYGDFRLFFQFSHRLGIIDMTLRDIYNKNVTLLGSPTMIAFYESLEDIPYEDRKVFPRLSTISITSDGFMIINGVFYGSVQDLEDNLHGLCEHFNIDDSEVSRLMRNTVDWRKGGNAYSY